MGNNFMVSLRFSLENRNGGSWIVHERVIGQHGDGAILDLD